MYYCLKGLRFHQNRSLLCQVVLKSEQIFSKEKEK